MEDPVRLSVINNRARNLAIVRAHKTGIGYSMNDTLFVDDPTNFFHATAIADLPQLYPNHVVLDVKGFLETPHTVYGNVSWGVYPSSQEYRDALDYFQRMWLASFVSGIQMHFMKATLNNYGSLVFESPNDLLLCKLAV